MLDTVILDISTLLPQHIPFAKSNFSATYSGIKIYARGVFVRLSLFDPHGFVIWPHYWHGFLVGHPNTHCVWLCRTANGMEPLSRSAFAKLLHRLLSDAAGNWTSTANKILPNRQGRPDNAKINDFGTGRLVPSLSNACLRLSRPARVSWYSAMLP